MILKRIKVQMKFVGETNCYIVIDEKKKEALNIIGYNFGNPRLPLVSLSDTNKEKLQNSLKNFGLI